ncbi:MAG: hypothetical protein K6F84_07865, partial [Lachnospiraceae bacterium]|nr:hypothetical protein [Lachnospiraceae bacterium]
MYMSDSVLAKLNSKYTSDNQRKNKVDAESEPSRLEFYLDAKEKEKRITVKFLTVDPEGNFFGKDKDVNIVLNGAETVKEGHSNNTYASPRLLGREIIVTVESIDVSSKTVRVTKCKTGGLSKADYTKLRVNKEIQASLSNGNHPVIWGRVKGYYKDMVNINIFDTGLIGNVTVREWSKAYTRNLSVVAKEGEVYQFEIIGESSKRGQHTYPI